MAHPFNSEHTEDDVHGKHKGLAWPEFSLNLAQDTRINFNC